MATDYTKTARECGARVDDSMVGNIVAMFEDELEAFAERIRAQERERCAVICEGKGERWEGPWSNAAKELAAQIRNGKAGG